MPSLSTLLSFATLAAALPARDDSEHMFARRQGGMSLGGIGSLLQMAGSGKLGQYMGEPEATEAFTSLAKFFGATKTSPGGLQAYSIGQLNKGYGIVADPAGASAKRVVLKTRVSTPGAQTIKVRYGPYKVPSTKHVNGLGQAGMLSNFPHSGMAKPCEGECTILGMSAGLEYADGRNANIDSGMWLHHMVLFNVGPGREDPPCAQRDVSLPHVSIGATSRNSERIFASGNERSEGIIPNWGIKDTGYKLQPADKFAALVELMNQTPQDQTVYLTMTYDIIAGHPYKDDVKVLWFDVRQCGTSEVNPPKNQTRFVLDYQWTASFDGELIGAIGHLHDGGERTTLAIDNKLTCTNVAKYGTKPEFIQPASLNVAPPTAGGHTHGGDMPHISDMNVCHGPSLVGGTSMRKGQVWTLKAYYDLDKYRGMAHEDGSLEEVMGIEILFVRRKAA
ncbi:hypothetical protein EJ06DRAFT_581331 [Trichodelitschia bisporula]|uniref:Uncharacterized protein n=1 Tax=Trichodelitschia bisporula TaxID=703511 RepID=A0A6G1HZ84_9PEZI|nr:hypothetical protein EJ06DRAFT_581331 [Trichodelitschia bisporula]